MAEEGPGYTDTPELPHSEYRVHDARRPQPPVVEAGSGLGIESPPADATILFDGGDAEKWIHPDGRSPEWDVTDDYMQVVDGTGYLETKQAIGDCHLHLEWAAPSVVSGDGQGRGNSGVFLQSRYEIQVLDSYQNETYADGHAGAVYGQYPPAANPTRPPGEWQAYDILWHGPRFDGDDLIRPASVTVLFNGVVVQDAVELIGPTDHKATQSYEPHPEEAPLQLQDHGDAVRYRNIWYRPL